MNPHPGSHVYEEMEQLSLTTGIPGLSQTSQLAVVVVFISFGQIVCGAIESFSKITKSQRILEVELSIISTTVSLEISVPANGL